MNDPAAHAALATLWERVLEDPADEERHQKLIAFAVEQQLYLPAIQRYTALAEERPELAPSADKYKKQIGALAAAKVFATRERPAAHRGRWFWRTLTVCAAVSLVLSEYGSVAFWMSVVWLISAVALWVLSRRRA
jgi:protein involved in temperature-dependent protein secretion